MIETYKLENSKKLEKVTKECSGKARRGEIFLCFYNLFFYVSQGKFKVYVNTSIDNSMSIPISIKLIESGSKY